MTSLENKPEEPYGTRMVLWVNRENIEYNSHAEVHTYTNKALSCIILPIQQSVVGKPVELRFPL